MNNYDKTIAAWNKVAEENNIAAIHPAGAKGQSAFEESGKYDAARIAHFIVWLGLNPLTISILDYGCGLGRVSFPLCSYFKSVYAWDSSTVCMHKLLTGHDFYPVNLSPVVEDPIIPFADAAFSISVFIHHPYAEGCRMLKEVADMVKPGGYLLLQIPIYDYAKEPTGWTDCGVWDIGQFKAAADAAGCEYIDIKTNPGEFSFKNIGRNHHEFQILRKYE